MLDLSRIRGFLNLVPVFLALGLTALLSGFVNAATITGFSPLQCKLGTVVTITGTGFTGATAVKIGGVAATGVTVVSDTKITAVAGAATTTGFIVVTTPAGSATTSGTTLGAWSDGKITSYCQPAVDINKSLAIRDPSVLNDARAKGETGVWSFNFLMSQMAPTGMSTSLFIKKWLTNWQKTTKVNTFTISASTGGIGSLLASWPRAPGFAAEADGTLPLDLSVDKFNLVAIMFRPDLTGNAVNIAGEGRFVFSVGSSLDEIIFEYKLPISSGTTPITSASWMNRIFLLTQFVTGASFNARLQTVTDVFTKKTFVGVSGMQNGSAINQVRTNTIGLEGTWRLREFRLTPTAVVAAPGVVAAGVGELVNWTTKGNPSDTLNVPSGTLEAWAVANQAALMTLSPPEPPTTMWGGGTAEGPWNFSTAVTPAAKQMFSMNTCKGCHNGGTNLNFNAGSSISFLQASPSGFASFMTGTTSGAVANRKVLPATAMPGGFSAPFTPKSDGTFTANSGYSDLHARAHNMIGRLITAFCQ